MKDNGDDTKDQMSPVTSWGAIKKLQAQLWRRSTLTLQLIRRGKEEEDEDLGYLRCGLPRPVVSTSGGSRFSVLDTGAGEGLDQPLWWGWGTSQCQLLGGTGMREGLCAGGWRGTMGHSPCAGCWRGRERLCLPQTSCALEGGCSSLKNLKLDQGWVGCPVSSRAIGSVLVFWGRPAIMPMRWVCVC